MNLPGIRKAVQATAEEKPPPLVNGWAVPPMGSMGDAWDEVLKPPEESPLAGARKKRRKRARPSEVIFLEWVPVLHWAAIIAWVSLAMALLSTGPAYPLMGVFAGIALLFSAWAVISIRIRVSSESGERYAWAALGLSIALLVLDHMRPVNPYYQALLTASPRRAVGNLSLEEKLEYTATNMQLMARIAACASLARGDKAVDKGNDSVHSLVNPHSGYFPISTLAMPDSLAEGFEQDFIVYAPEDLPRDIFADDPRATFGVFFTKRHILIYSAGPDGVWQINPRLPVNKGSEDPMAELQPFALPPGAGQGGVGDIILILDRRTAEDSADCYSLRVQLHPSGE